MLRIEPVDHAAQRLSLGAGLRERLLMALVLYSLMPADALSGERPQSAETARNVTERRAAQAPLAMPFAMPLAPPFALAAPRLDPQTFSPTEFRPRRSELLTAASAPENAVIDAPMQHDTSIAHELSQSKSQNRVRLLTLWQNRASSLSLQAGKRGAPSLQWSTPWMHRDSASRGLFDRLLSDSPRAFGAGRSAVSHQSGAVAPARPLDLSPLPNNK